MIPIYIYIYPIKMVIRVAYFVMVLMLYFSSSNYSFSEATIGMNWGRNTYQRLIPSQVVDLLLQNGIRSARIYTSQDDILNAFAGSGISLATTVFSYKNVQTLQQCQTVVELKRQSFVAANVSRILIGSHTFSIKANVNPAIEAYKSLQEALNMAGLSNIKVALPQDINYILKANITKPSEAEFREEVKDAIIRFVKELKEQDGPFVFDAFPIDRIQRYNWDISFAFHDDEANKQVITDVHGATYTNYFEFEYDSLVWAMEKIGAPDIKLVVGSIGWPTDGYPNANFSTAEQFYKGFLPYLASNKGTPKRPGTTIEAYIHSLTDENRMPDGYPFMRHFGIYTSNGEPKYKIDMSGQGRDIFPTKVSGINRMPGRWCVFNEGFADGFNEHVQETFHRACQLADCTSLMPGGSCSGLTWRQNVSYALNMYFQSTFQAEDSCIPGVGKLVTEDPSVGSCVFPVEVVRGNQDDFLTYFIKETKAQGKNFTWTGAAGNRVGDNLMIQGYCYSVFALLFLSFLSLY